MTRLTQPTVRAWGGALACIAVLAALTLHPAPVHAAVPTIPPQSHTVAEDSSLDLTITVTDPDGGDFSSAGHTAPANGTISDTVFFVDTGVLELRYTPDPDFNGTDSFGIVVTDDQGESSGLQPVNITVTPVNDSFTTVDDAFTVSEDGTLTGNVLDNDVDPDGDVYVSRSESLHVLLDGSFTYSPPPDFHGSFDFDYTAYDGTDIDTATVTITVTPVNDAPSVTGVNPTIDEDDLAGAVSIIATDVDGDVITPHGIVTQPTHGTAIDGGGTSTTGFANQVYTYVPDADFNGTDTLTVRFTDEHGAETLHTETITVNPVNDGPVAQPGGYPGNENVAVSETLSATDVDGDTLTYAIDTGPAHGTLSGFDATTGDFTYTSDIGFSGTDTFTFTATDGSATSLPATITLTINGSPLVDDATLTGTEDTALAIDAHDLAADPDHTDADLTYTITAPPSLGTVVDETPADATDAPFTYNPNPEATGTDTFTIEVCDPDGLCDTGTITIAIAPVNDPPTVDTPTIDVTVEEDGSTSGDIDVTDPDNTEADLTYTVVDQPEHGTATAGSYAYSPDPDFFGTDTFTIEVCDPDGLCDLATINVTVTPINDAPTGADQQLDATVGDTVTLTAPHTDVDDDPLTYTWAQTAGPAVQLANPNAATATFAPGQSGTHVFTATACEAPQV